MAHRRTHVGRFRPYDGKNPRTGEAIHAQRKRIQSVRSTVTADLREDLLLDQSLRTHEPAKVGESRVRRESPPVITSPAGDSPGLTVALRAES
jgi:hypothetical protein